MTGTPKFRSGRLKILFGIFLFIFLFFGNTAGAWVLGEPLVPCGSVSVNGGVCEFSGDSGTGECVGGTNGGNPCNDNWECGSQPSCTQCEVLHLVDNLMDFILIAAAPILATFFFIVAGLYIMLGGAKPDMLATGKRMFTSALLGIIIVMLAWLVTNTLITTLVSESVRDTGGNLIFNSADWWRLNCTSIGLSNVPPGQGGRNGGGGGGGGGSCTAPICISNVQITSNNSSATVTWTTNVAGNGGVDYGLTGSFGQGPVFQSGGSSTNHTVTVSGVQSNTAFCFQAFSAPVGGSYLARAPAPAGIFVTDGRGSGGSCGGGGVTVTISGEQATPSGPNMAITWNTNLVSSTQVQYREQGSPGWTTVGGAGGVTSHSAMAVGLSPGRVHEYQVISVDSASGYRAVGSIRTFTTP